MERLGRGVVIATVATVATCALAGPAAANWRELPHTTPDGSFVYPSWKSLVPSDNDSALDLYVWDGRRNKLATPGTSQSIAHSAHSDTVYGYAISADGRRVVFTTRERLMAADVDSTEDVYERWGDQYRLLSTGPADDGSGVYVEFRFMAPDASRVIFETAARLVAADTDSSPDVYMSSNGTTTLVSASPPGGGGESYHRTDAVSTDLIHVFVRTSEPLVPSDRDASEDVYEHRAGTTRLASTGTLDEGMTKTDASESDVSEDGSSLIFGTRQRLETGDANDRTDFYQRKGGRTRLITGNTAGVSTPCNAVADEPVSPCDYWYGSQTPDGGSIAFSAGQPLTVDDTNNTLDYYLRTGSSIARIAPNSGYSLTPRIHPDGSRIVFASRSQLAAADTDAVDDVYQYEGGRISLLTPFEPVDGMGFVGIMDQSRDLTHVFLNTSSGFDPRDLDGRVDFYEVHAGRLRLVTTGPTDNHGPGGDTPRDLEVVPDGSGAYFVSDKPLVPEDVDSADDIYQWKDGVTTLVSQP